MEDILSANSSSNTEHSIDFWPKKIGAKIGARHSPTLFVSAQVVNSTWVFGKGSGGWANLKWNVLQFFNQNYQTKASGINIGEIWAALPLTVIAINCDDVSIFANDWDWRVYCLDVSGMVDSQQGCNKEVSLSLISPNLLLNQVNQV
jgi:hypothetical protein